MAEKENLPPTAPYQTSITAQMNQMSGPRSQSQPPFRPPLERQNAVYAPSRLPNWPPTTSRYPTLPTQSRNLPVASVLPVRRWPTRPLAHQYPSHQYHHPPSHQPHQYPYQPHQYPYQPHQYPSHQPHQYPSHQYHQSPAHQPQQRPLPRQPYHQLPQQSLQPPSQQSLQPPTQQSLQPPTQQQQQQQQPPQHTLPPMVPQTHYPRQQQALPQPPSVWYPRPYYQRPSYYYHRPWPTWYNRGWGYPQQQAPTWPRHQDPWAQPWAQQWEQSSYPPQQQPPQQQEDEVVEEDVGGLEGVEEEEEDDEGEDEPEQAHRRKKKQVRQPSPPSPDPRPLRDTATGRVQKRKRPPPQPLLLSSDSEDPNEPTSSIAMHRKRSEKVKRAMKRRDAQAASSSKGQENQEEEEETELFGLSSSSDEYEDLEDDEDLDESPRTKKRRVEQEQNREKRRQRFGSPTAIWPGFHPNDFFELEELQAETSTVIPVCQRRFKLRLKPLQLDTRTYDEVIVKISAIFESAMELLIMSEDPRRWGRLIALNKNFYSEGFSSEFVPLHQLDIRKVLDQLLAALNSDETIDLQSTVFELYTIPEPPDHVIQAREKERNEKRRRVRRRRRGGGGWRRSRPVRTRTRFGWMPGIRGRNILDKARWLRKRRSVHNPTKFLLSRKVQTEFKASCVPLAFVDGLYHANHPHPEKRALAAWYRSRERFRLTRELSQSVRREEEGGGPGLGPFDEAEILEMAQFLSNRHPNVRFSIFTAPVQPIHVIGSNQHHDTFVDLLLYEGHCYVLRKLHVYLGGSSVCRGCNMPVHNQGHRCLASQCRSCYNSYCLNSLNLDHIRVRIPCNVCLTGFKSRACLAAHTAVANCKKRTRCMDCLQLFSGNSHVCLPPVCSKCGLAKPAYHICWVWANAKDKEAGDRFKAARHQGGEQGGVQQNGPEEQGDAHQGGEQGGVQQNGPEEQGDAHQGGEQGGVQQNGPEEQGDAHQGGEQGGVQQNGPEEQGDAHQGGEQGGVQQNGPEEQGDVHQGGEQGGVQQNGPEEQGDAHQGGEQGGVQQNGPEEQGDVHQGGEQGGVQQNGPEEQGDAHQGGEQGDEDEMDNLYTADFECQTNETTGAHEPVLLVLYRMKDGEEEIIEYVGLECTEQFITDVVETDRFKGKSIGFHNGSRYDSIFILKAFLDRQIVVDVLPRGNQLLSLQYKPKKLRFFDTYLHMPLPLRSLPKAFDVADVGDKGHFPYLLNVSRYLEGQGEGPDGQHYEDYGLPPLQLFDPENMKEKDAKELETWWLETDREMRQRQERYQVVESLRKYCIGDCRILYACLHKYIDQIKKEFPGLKVLISLTSSAFANRLYRAFFGKEKTIAVIEPEGYGREYGYSDIALAWLYVQKLKYKLDWLRDARHGGEVSLLPGRFVDGYGARRVRSESGGGAGGDEDGVGGETRRTGKDKWEYYAFQFQGCKWHGCIKCEEASEEQREAYADTVDAANRLKTLGANPNSVHGQFQYIQVWECEFTRQRRENPELDMLVKRYLNSLSREPLNPRQALYGGRTEVFRHLVDTETEPGELFYDDMVSLYPYSLSYERLPVGIPRIFISEPELEEAPPLDKAFGLVSAHILPPRDYIHAPPLPYRTKKSPRLVFPLCGACAELAGEGKECPLVCPHSDVEREMEGVWVTAEINAAVKAGYKVTKIRELWHWESSSSTLFRDYIATLFARKYEATGWGEGIVTEEDKKREVEFLRRRYGILINPDKVSPNAAARNAAKINLNSAWGYICRHGNTPQIVFLNNMDDIYDIICDDNVTLKDTRLVGDLMLVQYQEEREHPTKTGNVPLGSLFPPFLFHRFERKVLKMFCDGLGKIASSKLYAKAPRPRPLSLLCRHRLNDLFCPTRREGSLLRTEFRPRGNEGFEDELDGGVGSVFSAVAPKSYRLVYKRASGEEAEIVRAKGLSLSTAASRVLTGNQIQAVARDPSLQVSVPQRQFKRQSFTQPPTIHSISMLKLFKFSDIKRLRIRETETTRPLGSLVQ